MRISRVYYEGALTVNSRITLPMDTRHYLINVLRLKINAPLVLFNGQGGQYDGELIEFTKKEAIVLVKEFHASETESALHIHLAQAISKGDKMDLAIQKAVELGVSEITPIMTEFCAVKLDEERLVKREQHWHKIIIAACEQSGRTKVPVLNRPQALLPWLRQLQNHEVKLYCHPQSSRTIQGLLAVKDLLLLIGPEGGFSHDEVNQIQAANFLGVGLGPRILRTETAAVAAIAILQGIWGDLN